MIHGTPFKMLLGNNVTTAAFGWETTIWRSSGTDPLRTPIYLFSAVSSTRGLARLAASLALFSPLIALVASASLAARESRPAGAQTARTAAAAHEGKQLYDEYLQLRAANASSRHGFPEQAKRSIPDPRHPGEDAAAGLKGVMLRPFRSRRSRSGGWRGIPGDTDAPRFLRSPLRAPEGPVVQEVPTLALKDTTAIRDRPDTTPGTLTRQSATHRSWRCSSSSEPLVALDGHIPLGPVGTVEGRGTRPVALIQVWNAGGAVAGSTASARS